MEAFLSRRKKSLYWYLLGTLVAVELLMSFSFLGYIHVEPISITLAYIPVLLTGALMGPLESTLLGTVFGLASMWKASASYVMALDQLFSPTMSGHPLESVLLSVGSRMLFGLLIGLLYMAARHGRFAGLWIGLVSFFGRTLHAVLVYAALWAFFPKAGYTPVDALSDFMSFNGLLSSAVSTALVLLCWYVSRSQTWQQFQHRLETVHSLQLGEHYHSLSLIAIIAVTLGAAVAVAFYFVHRMESVLAQMGTPLSETGYADLLHLQIQFLIGILSMMALVIIFLAFNRRYSTYKNREAKIDSLTGTLNRRAFFQTCTKALRSCSASQGASCYFLMVDLDFFKSINATYGHPEGDRALKETARVLQEVFGQDSLIGRVGGDEFALLLYTPTTRGQLEMDLQRLQEQIHRLQWGKGTLSCSVGALPIAGSGIAAEQLYQEADALLYTAKEQGRGRYVIGTPAAAGTATAQ